MHQKFRVVNYICIRMSTLLIPEFYENGFLFSTDNKRLQLASIHRFLSEESYWAQRIPFETVQQSVENSLCIGIYEENGQQAGFGRMITDQATFAYLADIFIVKMHRGKGLSKIMMRMFCEAAEHFGLRRFILTTQDAHSLYAQFGFVPFPWPERMMSRPGRQY